MNNDTGRAETRPKIVRPGRTPSRRNVRRARRHQAEQPTSAPSAPASTRALTFPPPVPERQSALITVDQFATVYRACEYALLNGYPLSSHVTMNWSAMGITDEASVLDCMSAFTACLRDYLARRCVPPLWVYSHEFGQKYGWHTHFALFLPVDVAEARIEVMAWLRNWPVRQFGRRMPKAVRQRVPHQHSAQLHWLLFSYLMKGCDRTTIVQSARNSPDGQPIRLPDLIAHQWRDPGTMNFRKRVGCSQALDRGQQAHGVPARWCACVPKPVSIPGPFRSTFDDGVFDVRRLYGKAFCDWIKGAEGRAMASSTFD